MKNERSMVAVGASAVPSRTGSSYPTVFAARVAGREKHRLGEFFGLRNFGVNLTRLPPGAESSLRHAHALQDELVFVLEGHPVLRTDDGELELSPGMCAGFRAGSGNAHHLINRAQAMVVYLEIGDRTPGDHVVYPDDDLAATFVDGVWRFLRKDGTPYEGSDR